MGFFRRMLLLQASSWVSSSPSPQDAKHLETSAGPSLMEQPLEDVAQELSVDHGHQMVLPGMEVLHGIVSPRQRSLPVELATMMQKLDCALMDFIAAVVSALPPAQHQPQPQQQLQQQPGLQLQQLQLQQLQLQQQPQQQLQLQPQPRQQQPQQQNNTAQGREACYSQGTPGYDPAKLCCEPYTCETIQPGVGKCTGTNLPEGSECWSETYSKGECASGLSCINNVCTVFTDNPSCLESGITGSNLCYLGALNEKVNKPCCNPAPSGSTNVWCLSSSDTSVADKFCMEYNIEENQACGTTEAFGYIGYCKKCWDGANGGLINQGRCCSGSDCEVTGMPFNDYFCP